MKRISGLVIAVTVAIVLLAGLLGLVRTVTSQTPNHDVIISEVAWAGTVHSAADEWIELYNRGSSPVDLDGWLLQDSSGDLAASLTGFIEPGEFYLLERTDDTTVSDIAADLIYTGGLNNSGETLSLIDADGVLIDTANADGADWPAGVASPDYVSMERVSPWSDDTAQGWADNDRVTTRGSDAGGNPINGTPRGANAPWAAEPGGEVDLAVVLDAAEFVGTGELLHFALELSNLGPMAAQNVVLTATLPPGVAYEADDSELARDVTVPGRITWFAGELASGDMHSFAMTGSVALTVEGTLTTTLSVGSSSPETVVSNNQARVTTIVAATDVGRVLINAVLYDGYELNDADEAVQLINLDSETILLRDWMLSDGNQQAAIEEGVTMAPMQSLWLARDAKAFQRQFGFLPDIELAPWPGFANVGDEVLLRNPDGQLVDTLVYNDGDVYTEGWLGPALRPYRAAGQFAEEGQILYRRTDESSGLPVVDSNRAEDWAQMVDDAVDGRKVQYPGWNVTRFWQPVVVNATNRLTVAVAPDNVYPAVARQIASAQHSIRIESLTIENVAIGEALVAAAARGVSVTVLLEGDPVGGIDDHERFVCQQLEEQGGQCWFMIRDDDLRIHDRYRYLHAKFMIVDEERAVISSENFSPNSMPDDDKKDGTWGRRGLLLITESSPVISRLLEIFVDDLAPATHHDLFRWQATHPVYGAPAEDFVPITVTGGTTYTVRYPEPFALQDATSLQLFHAPENIMHHSDGLLDLLREAGPGDTVLVQQLTERRLWGAADSTPLQDPNPRLEAMIDAARRGASVRLMLDSFFDDEEHEFSNNATCRYVNDTAVSERLRLSCVLANPAGLGIHNKMVLLHIGGQGWVHVGSWNGTEQSTKGNREVALLFHSDAAYAYLASLFEGDWPHDVWFPLAVFDFHGPSPHPLISEIMYDPSGPDDAEFIEIANGLSSFVDLSGWTISDAVAPADFEDARQFPADTILGPRSALVVALSAAGFENRFGFLPDFEIVDSRVTVPDLIDDLGWGEPEAILQMGNLGDELLLRDPWGAVVDAIAYGNGHVSGTMSCALLPGPGYSLERLPFWRDSNDCTRDFRAWPLPSPGSLP